MAEPTEQPLAELLEQIARLTGGERPALIDAEAPVLCESALGDAQLYLVGLIGGKDVGKTSLVNAIAGRELGRPAGWGVGTDRVIAYGHVQHERAIERLLQSIVPGQWTFVGHDITELGNQVLLDLPDIDSIYESHVQITRRMLRHMLFPIWVQSVEKYADQRPQQLLAAVAESNAMENFLFCLNKADYVRAEEAPDLAADYAARIAKVLSLPAPPKVYVVSALRPAEHDLPALRAHVNRPRSPGDVAAARGLAHQQRRRSALRWIDAQGLDQRLQQLRRLEQHADEELRSRLGVPLIDRAVAGICDDPAYRMSLADALMERRIARWPIVNVLHVLLAPLVSALRGRLPGAVQDALASPRELAEQHLRRAFAGSSVASKVQAAFALLHQAHPNLSELYGHTRPWEPAGAEPAAEALCRRLAETVELQRQVVQSAPGGLGFISGAARWLLTVGAAVWFPIAQPVLEAYLAGGVGDLAVLVVRALGASYLLTSAGFLLVWYVFLWLAIRHASHRRIARLLQHWRMGEADSSLDLARQVVAWIEDLLAPLRQAAGRMEFLLQRVDEFRKTVSRDPSA